MSLSSLSSIVGLTKFISDPPVKTWNANDTLSVAFVYDVILYNDIYYTCLNNIVYRASTYDLSIDTLSPAGAGVTPGSCYAVALNPYNDKIYYGGTFTADNSSNTMYGGIAEYDYSNNTLSSLSDSPSFSIINVRCLAVDNSGNLFFGGTSTSLNGGANNCVHMYNGTTTSAVTGGVTPPNNNIAFAMAYDSVSNDLYVGGSFQERLMKWDGSSWSVIYYTGTTFLNGIVRTLHYNDGTLYVGGNFTNAGSYIASYNISNSSWSTLGSGLVGPCYSITSSPYSNNIYMSAQTGTTNSRVYQFTPTSTDPEEISLLFNANNSGNNIIYKILVINNRDDLLVGTSMNNYDGVSGKAFFYE